MNAPEEKVKEMSYDKVLGQHEMAFKMIFGGNIESQYCYDTYQFEDYNKVVSDMFDVEQKAKRREEVFPYDCKKAFELGERLVSSG